MRLPAVKVCGVTRTADAIAAVELGATHLGLNFWPPSPRHVSVATAETVAEAVRGRVALVGVFVDARPDDVEATAAAIGLDLVQLHGDESPVVARELARRGLQVLKAFRGTVPDGSELAADWGGCWGWLFEERHHARGGTGRTWDWSRLAGFAGRRPWFVAGGVAPETVGAVIRACAPWGLDVCSGVEARPGVKDPERLARLFVEVRRHAQAPSVAAS